MMNGRGKSDGPVVPTKPPNKRDADTLGAEAVEGRGPAKGNVPQQDVRRTQSRDLRTTSLLEHVREVAFHARTRGKSPVR